MAPAKKIPFPMGGSGSHLIYGSCPTPVHTLNSTLISSAIFMAQGCDLQTDTDTQNTENW